MLKNLLKIRYISFVGTLFGQSKSGKQRSRGKVILFSLLMLYVVSAFAFMSGGFAYLVAPVMISLEMDWLFFTLFNLAALTGIFIISIFETKSALFECRDNELLLSMPIKPRDIVLSRILWVLIMNLGMGVLLMLPAIVVYAAEGGALSSVIGGILVMLLLPILATALSVGVGYLVARIAKLFKRKNLITLILSLLFLAAYFFVYARIMSATEMLEGDVGAFIGNMSDKLSIFRALGEISLLTPIPFSVFVTVTVLVSLCAYLFVSKSFFKIVTDSGKTKREEYRRSRLLRSTPFRALCRKEFARFFSSAIYMLNAAFGVIMELVLAVLVLVKSDMIFELAPAFSELLGVDIDLLLAGASAMVMLAIAFTNSVSASALSLEGHSFWILRSAPVSTLDLIHAKLVPHLAVTVPVGIISSVLLSVAVRAELIYALLIVFASVIANVFMALFGLVINIAIPKFDYENEAVVVKQSGAMAIVALGGMLGGMLLAILGVYLTTLIGIFAILLVLTLLLILSVVIYFVLTGPMGHRLEGMDI